jgi:hypothetical protein
MGFVQRGVCYRGLVRTHISLPLDIDKSFG